jgi:prepilin-type N-terminal cleavage/methylation domain-containing protein
MANSNASILPARLRPGRARSGFTMIEIALCLAIIGFALVSILLILPLGMDTQRATREETIIGQDASVLLQAISTGARGDDDLTNYVYAIVVTNVAGVVAQNLGYVNPVLTNIMNFSTASFPTVSQWYPILTNGANIVGLLSTPLYTDGSGNLVNDLAFANNTNYVWARIRSLSGLAAEKPPQDNSIMEGDTFSYQIRCVNAPEAADTNVLNKNSPFYSPYTSQWVGNQRELRLLFLWPLLANGALSGIAHLQTFRTTIAGQLEDTNINYLPTFGNRLYYYQSQSFTNTP